MFVWRVVWIMDLLLSSWVIAICFCLSVPLGNQPNLQIRLKWRSWRDVDCKVLHFLYYILCALHIMHTIYVLHIIYIILHVWYNINWYVSFTLISFTWSLSEILCLDISNWISFSAYWKRGIWSIFLVLVSWE